MVKHSLVCKTGNSATMMGTKDRRSPARWAKGRPRESGKATGDSKAFSFRWCHATRACDNLFSSLSRQDLHRAAAVVHDCEGRNAKSPGWPGWVILLRFIKLFHEPLQGFEPRKRRLDARSDRECMNGVQASCNLFFVKGFSGSNMPAVKAEAFQANPLSCRQFAANYGQLQQRPVRC